MTRLSRAAWITSLVIWLRESVSPSGGSWGCTMNGSSKLESARN